MARLGAAVLAALLAAAACLPAPAEAGGATFGGLDTLAASSPRCKGAVGECGVGDDEELGVGGDGAGEALRRALAARQPTNRYISYAALRADQVPCNQRGKSYYANCASQQPANPYRRGCSQITRCARNMS
ncbi:hypothetical protein ACP70R_030964 [Stipagrostis hirtigluma subsp. patula]